MSFLSAALNDLRGDVNRFADDAAAAFDDVQADLEADLSTDPGSGSGNRSVLTGTSEVAREDAYTYSLLAAVPRFEQAAEGAFAGAIVGDEAFQIVETYEDPASGFFGLHLRSLSEGRDVFAVDGLGVGSAVDAVSSLGLAQSQAESAAFHAAVEDARDVALTEGRAVVFTGPSLGGALAQAGGYETQEAILAANPAGGPQVTFLTIDSLGGLDATQAINGGGLDPAVLAQMNGLNIRTEGDIVSRIGAQIGDTVTFPAVDAAGNPVSLPPEELHVNTESLLATLQSDQLWAAGVRGAPNEIDEASALSGVVGPAVADAFDDLNLGQFFEEPTNPGLPGVSGPDPSGRFFDVDADADGQVDLRLFHEGVTPGTGDLLIA